MVHGIDDIAEDLVCRDVAIHLVDYLEFLDVEMNERIVAYPVIHRHLKEGEKVVPVVVVCNRIDESFLVQEVLVYSFGIVIYDGWSPVACDLHAAEDPELVAAVEYAYDFGFFFECQVAVVPVCIVVFADLPEHVPDGLEADIDIVIDLHRIEERAVQSNMVNAFRVVYVFVVRAEFYSNHSFP